MQRSIFIDQSEDETRAFVRPLVLIDSFSLSSSSIFDDQSRRNALVLIRSATLGVSIQRLNGEHLFSSTFCYRWRRFSLEMNDRTLVDVNSFLFHLPQLLYSSLQGLSPMTSTFLPTDNEMKFIRSISSSFSPRRSFGAQRRSAEENHPRRPNDWTFSLHAPQDRLRSLLRFSLSFFRRVSLLRGFSRPI